MKWEKLVSLLEQLDTPIVVFDDKSEKGYVLQTLDMYQALVDATKPDSLEYDASSAQFESLAPVTPPVQPLASAYDAESEPVPGVEPELVDIDSQVDLQKEASQSVSAV